MERKEYTITLYTENSIGLIGRISGIFSRRKINIESLILRLQKQKEFTVLVIHETEDV
jgi:acetolactate synthase-1/3 small subunit